MRIYVEIAKKDLKEAEDRIANDIDLAPAGWWLEEEGAWESRDLDIYDATERKLFHTTHDEIHTDLEGLNYSVDFMN